MKEKKTLLYQTNRIRSLFRRRIDDNKLTNPYRIMLRFVKRSKRNTDSRVLVSFNQAIYLFPAQYEDKKIFANVDDIRPKIKNV